MPYLHQVPVAMAPWAMQQVVVLLGVVELWAAPPEVSNWRLTPLHLLWASVGEREVPFPSLERSLMVAGLWDSKG